MSDDHKKLSVERETDDGFETIECDLPVLLTAAERLIRPIKVKQPQLEAGRQKSVAEVTARDLCADTSMFGFLGSPTLVKRDSLARTLATGQDNRGRRRIEGREVARGGL